MDFEELIYGLNQTVFSLSKSVVHKRTSVLNREEQLEWSSYVVTAGDEIIESILCSTIDITSTLCVLRNKYEKARYLSKKVNPSRSIGIFDVYIVVLDEIASFILEQEAKTDGR